jgi:hypothetical protein
MIVAYFMLGVGLLLTLLLLARRLATADPRLLAQGVRIGGGVAAAGLALFLIVSGRWPFAAMAASLALPLLSRWRRSRGQAQSTAGAGSNSEIRTRLLHMTLDHATGEMTGEVLAGARVGRSLASLGLGELVDLLAECQIDDGEAVPLLEAYLNRRFGGDWQDEAERRAAAGGGQRPAAAAANMTRREALEMLGLEEGASREQIKEAYRRLMAKLHPDAGGSAYLAAKLNQARDLLLGG